MPPSLTPWLALIGIAVAVLAVTGRLPALPFLRRSDTGAEETAPPPPVAMTTVRSVAADAEHLDSRTLGILLARAARREAEEEITSKAAMETVEQIKSTFKAPFTPPEAAQPAPDAGA